MARQPNLSRMVRPHPLRIGLDGDTLGRKRTGDESYLASLMRGLGRTDDANNYVVYVRDPAKVRPSFEELTRFAFRKVLPQSIWVRFPIGLPLALRRDPVDLLHVQYFVPPASPCPVIVTVHDISFAVRPEFFTRKDRFLLKTLVPWSLRRAARIITDVEYTKSDLVRMYDLAPENIEVIPLAADPRYRPMDRARCRQTMSERHGISGPFVLYVGTFQPRKNVATLIRAYGMFRERTGLPHKLVLTGKPKYMYQSVLDALNEARFPDDIVLTGFVAEPDLPIYYNAAAVFAFPSLYEGFGLPVLEAMACGTPVISSNVTSLPEVAGDAALLVDPTEPEAFCNALVQVLGDQEVASRLSQRGLEQAARFTWDRTARETLAVYRDVLNRSKEFSA